MRKPLLALLLVVAAFAGCTVPTEGPAPAEPDREMRYTVQNDASETARIVLTAAPENTTTFRVTYHNGTSRTVTAPTGSATPAVPDDTVAVVPVGPSVITRDYTLTPGSGVGGSFTEAPANATLVTSVGFPGGAPYPGVSAARCSPDANLSMTLTVTDGGDSVTVVCS